MRLIQYWGPTNIRHYRTKLIGHDDLQPWICSLLKQNTVWTVQGVDWRRSVHTRAVRKVSSHYEYLENRSRGLDVTWQPVRGDLIAHPWTVTLPWGSSVGSETPLTELVYCVTVAFTMTERADQLHHDNAPAHSTALVQAFFWHRTSHHPGLSAPLQPSFGSLRLLAFPRAKIADERQEICECDGHTVHKVSQRHLAADWLAPRENDCSRMHSKVSSDWLPSYIKATRPVLEIFKMAGYFPDIPSIVHCK
jgi:hypothetical protein